LRKPGIGGNHDQYGILRRADIDRRQGADEILEHPDLQPPDEIAEVIVQDADVDRLATVSARPPGVGRAPSGGDACPLR